MQNAHHGVAKTLSPILTPRRWMALAALAMSSLLPVAPALAAAPPAGAIIGNQATANYVDGAGTARSTSSNLVQTVVSQVFAVDIEASQSHTATPGSTAYFPHVITNPGNGSDSYNLTSLVNAGTFAFATVLVYPDANQDGVPDNFTPITVTPTLVSGGTYGIVIAAVVPGTATTGQTDTFNISATSVGGGATVVDTNTDTVTLTSNAVITVTKAESAGSGNPGFTPLTFTFTYTNSGNATATNVTLTDVLDARFTYVAGSARWSVSGATALGDGVGGDPTGIDYNATGQTITAAIASVPPSQTGFVSFQVTVSATAAPGNVPNSATLSYNDGAATVAGSTNAVNFTVNQVASVDLSDSSGGVNSGSDQDATNNDVVFTTSAAQGAVVSFDNVVRNTGNGTDTFDITTLASSFPAGTSFQLFRGDGLTPLTDSNGNSVPDTGPLAPGATSHVVLRATLPPLSSGAGPFSVTKRATSAANPAVFNDTTDRLGSINANSVDLTNDSAGGPGSGIGPEAAPVTTLAVNPGQSATFTLVVANSGVADNYDLAASTDASFATTVLPTGWTVQFRRASDSAVITNTGTLAGGASITVLAVVTVPANSAPVTAQNLYFRALSPVTGTLDRKLDAVTVNLVRDLAATPNNSGQGFPSGSVDYPHLLTNNGNAAEPSAALAVGNDSAAWTSVIYYDANGNGIVDATDPIITNISAFGGLAAGASARVIVRVFVPAAATAGQINTTTLSIDSANAITETNETNNAAQDVTTVVTGDVQLSKTQALDLTCDGTVDTAFSAAQQSAAPGQCIVYRITATNSGSTTVTSVVINDATPPNTAYETCGGACAATVSAGAVTTPASGASGALATDGTTLTSSTSKILQFSVRVNQ